jgi:hypothetical protein
MICQNCGAHVPFAGNICPKCHSSKAQSQIAGCLTWFVVFPLSIVVWIITGHWYWAMMFFFVLGVAASATAKISYKNANRRRKLKD